MIDEPVSDAQRAFDAVLAVLVGAALGFLLVGAPALLVYLLRPV